MLLTILTNRWVLMIVCMLLVFGEMFFAKKWFLALTVKIGNAKVRRGLNVFFGLGTCYVLAMAQMYALCDVLQATFYWKFVIAAAIGATTIYLIIEKIFGEATVNELGKAFCEFVSHSDLFDGNLTTDGAVTIAKKLLTVTTAIDNKAIEKEATAVDEVVKRLNGFLADGKITADEQAEADKIIAASGIDLKGNSTYEKYKELLNK